MKREVVISISIVLGIGLALAGFLISWRLYLDELHSNMGYRPGLERLIFAWMFLGFPCVFLSPVIAGVITFNRTTRLICGLADSPSTQPDEHSSEQNYLKDAISRLSPVWMLSVGFLPGMILGISYEAASWQSAWGCIDGKFDPRNCVTASFAEILPMSAAIPNFLISLLLSILIVLAANYLSIRFSVSMAKRGQPTSNDHSEFAGMMLGFFALISVLILAGVNWGGMIAELRFLRPLCMQSVGK